VIGVVDSLLKAHERGDKTSTDGLVALLDRRDRPAAETLADARDRLLVEVARALYAPGGKTGT